jgi:hypothetical protein
VQGLFLQGLLVWPCMDSLLARATVDHQTRVDVNKYNGHKNINYFIEYFVVLNIIFLLGISNLIKIVYQIWIKNHLIYHLIYNNNPFSVLAYAMREVYRQNFSLLNPMV